MQYDKSLTIIFQQHIVVFKSQHFYNSYISNNERFLCQ